MIKSKVLKKAVKSIPKHTRILVRKQMEFAIQIKELISQDKKITQKSIAKQTGMKESYISRVIAGRTNLTLSTIAKFEAVFDKELIVIPKYYDKYLEKEINSDQTQNLIFTIGFIGNEFPLEKDESRKSSYYFNRNLENVGRSPVAIA